MSTGGDGPPRFSDDLVLPFETPSEQESHDAEARRKMVILVGRHARSAREFVDIIDMLGIEEELQELLLQRPDLLTAVTNLRLAAAIE